MLDHEALKFSQRLNEALDIRNYPSLGRGRISYIQEIFNISRAGANKWLHGKAIPHPKKRMEIATKLGISLKWLELGVGLPTDRDETIYEYTDKIAHEIPILNLRQAFNYGNIDDLGTFEKLVVSTTIPKSSLAIKNSGSAMEPKLSSDSLLIIDTSITTPSDGDYVIAKTKLLPEAIVRQYIKGAENDYLISINPKFEPIEIKETNVEILGKIIEIRSILD